MRFLKRLLPLISIALSILSCSLIQTVETSVPSTLEVSPVAAAETATIPESEKQMVPTGTSETENTTATESIPPQPVIPSGLKVAYIKDGDIWLWSSDDTKSQLTSSGMVYALNISDDGQVIAFLRQVDDFHAELWVINSDGTNERRLISVYDLDEMTADIRDPNAVAINPYHFDWVPDSHKVAFNTQQVFQGPGLFLFDDLRIIDADTNVFYTLLAPGQGGEFDYSPDGSQIAISTPTDISLVDSNGGDRRNSLPYDQVITYSEYRYYAKPVWAPDSLSLRVAIPPADPLTEPRLPTSLWYIPADGSLSYQMGSVIAEPFFSSEVSYSSDLSLIIFLRETGVPSENKSELYIAKPDGSGEWVYQKALLLQFKGWSPDASHFVFSKGEDWETQLGQVDAVPEPFTSDPHGIHKVRWIDDNYFLYLRENISTFDLLLESLDGELIHIDSIPAPPTQFDFSE